MYAIQSDITSKNTSINSKKLPAIYNRLDYAKLINGWAKETKFSSTPIILDIGCGRYSEHIEHFVSQRGFVYKGYDPYWKTEKENIEALSVEPFVVICSNVLNVIKSDVIYKSLQNLVRSFTYHDFGHILKRSLYYITVYEGDKSCIGQGTKPDCYQRNLPLSEYIFNYTDTIYKRTLTDLNGVIFLK